MRKAIYIIIVFLFAFVSCSDMIPWLEAGFIKEGDIIQATDSTGEKVEINVNDEGVVVNKGDPSEFELKYDENDDDHKPDRGTYVVYLDDNDDTPYVMHIDSDGNTSIEQRFTYEDDGQTITEMVPVTIEKVELTIKKLGEGSLAVDDKNVLAPISKKYLKGSKTLLSATAAIDYSFSTWLDKDKKIENLHGSKDANKVITLNEDKAEVQARFSFDEDGPLGKYEEIGLNFSDNGESPASTQVVYDDTDGKIDVLPQIVTLKPGAITGATVKLDGKNKTDQTIRYLAHSKVAIETNETAGSYTFNFWIVDTKSTKFSGMTKKETIILPDKNTTLTAHFGATGVTSQIKATINLVNSKTVGYTASTISEITEEYRVYVQTFNISAIAEGKALDFYFNPGDYPSQFSVYYEGYNVFNSGWVTTGATKTMTINTDATAKAISIQEPPSFKWSIVGPSDKKLTLNADGNSDKTGIVTSILVKETEMDLVTVRIWEPTETSAGKFGWAYTLAISD